MRILGLDMSSTCIGFALIEDGKPSAGGYEELKGKNIAARAVQAAHYVGRLFALHQPELTVLESPVGQHTKAIIPQARVSGAVLARLHVCEALWDEVAPSVAKVALAGKGNADKAAMVAAAAARLGLPGAPAVVKGKAVWRKADGSIALTEDEADALGVALAGLSIKVVTKGAA